MPPKAERPLRRSALRFSAAADAEQMAQEIAAGIWRLETDYLALVGAPLWLYLVGPRERPILLDTGVASTITSTLRAELKQSGTSLHHIALAVNSHAHPDHMGGNAALWAAGVRSFAGPVGDAEWLEDNQAVIDQLWGAYGDAFRLLPAQEAEIRSQLATRVRINRHLRDGDLIEVAGHALRTIVTAGHTRGHLALFDEPTRVLFTFDVVQGEGVPNVNGRIAAPLYIDRDHYVAGLERLRSIPFTQLAPSHGPVLSAGAGAELIELSLSWVRRVDLAVKKLVERSGHLTLYEVADHLGTALGAYGGVTLHTTAIAEAHLMSLVRKGELRRTWTAM
jgi:glyoxylase-like metal-dependent hydrolase (beta-lactamase superfamily II)